MVLLHDCIPCQYGDHSGHADVPGPVAKGVMGGWQCPCTGDCAERNPPEQRGTISDAPPPDLGEFEALVKPLAFREEEQT